MSFTPVLVGVGVVTAAVYGGVLLVTGFVACGISGCSGGGFGPAYAPRAAQVGLLMAGLVLLPLAVLVLHRLPRGRRAAGCAGVVVSGILLAMVLLELSPDGCPWGRARATAEAGTVTCSPDASP